MGRELKSRHGDLRIREKSSSCGYFRDSPSHSSLLPARLESSSLLTSFTDVHRAQTLYFSHLKSEERTEGLYTFKVSLQEQQERRL